MYKALRPPPPEPNFQVLSLRQPSGDGQTKLQARRYQKRKSHAKSRAGCVGCKVKRVKCDEAKPHCRRCQRNSLPCTYPLNPDDDLKHVLSKSHPVGDLVLSQRPELYGFPPEMELDKPCSPYGTPRIVLLKHFQSGFPDIFFGTPDDSGIVSLGFQRPHVLDAILAISASHLRHHCASPTSYRVAEHFQQALALRNFQAALKEPLDQNGADALLLTALLLNQLNFSIVYEGADPSQSWVFSNAPDRLNWLSLQMGMKPLLISTTDYHPNSSLKWMLDQPDDESKKFADRGLPLTNVPMAWRRVFGLLPGDPNPTLTNMFYEPVRVLAEASRLPPTGEMFFLYQAMYAKLDVEFRVLVEEGNERAMWLLAYWLGLLRRYDLWWLRGRTRRDYRAAVLWLEGRGVRGRAGELGRAWKATMDDLEEAPRWPSKRWTR